MGVSYKALRRLGGSEEASPLWELVELEYFGHRLYLLRLRNNC